MATQFVDWKTVYRQKSDSGTYITTPLSTWRGLTTMDARGRMEDWK